MKCSGRAARGMVIVIALLVVAVVDLVQAESNATIGVGDALVITLREIPQERSLDLLVSRDGELSLPYLPKPIRAAGLTGTELQKAIHDAYVPDYYSRIAVHVSVVTNRVKIGDAFYPAVVRKHGLRLIRTEKIHDGGTVEPVNHPLGDFWLPGEYEAELSKRIGIPLDANLFEREGIGGFTWQRWMRITPITPRQTVPETSWNGFPVDRASNRSLDDPAFHMSGQDP